MIGAQLELMRDELRDHSKPSFSNFLRNRTYGLVFDDGTCDGTSLFGMAQDKSFGSTPNQLNTMVAFVVSYDG
jgi:hypothetical protein